MTTMPTKNDEEAMAKPTHDRHARPRIGHSLLALALLGTTSGCLAGGPASEDVTAGALAALAPSTDVALAEATWRALPAGCEDVLTATLVRDDATLAVAPLEGEPSLSAVVVDGSPRCVDATPAVHDALRHQARAEALLAVGWRAFEQPTTPTGATAFQRSSETAGDPSPQPSAPPAPTTDTLTAQPNAGDPSPQPSDRTSPTAGDPSPQPSQPVREPSTAWSPTKTKP